MRRAAIVAAAAAVLVVAGCGGGESDRKDGVTIDWDLSRSHTTADVDWPKPEQDAVDVKPEGPVRILLPGGREFTGDGAELRHVFLRRRGDTVTEIQINGVPLEREAARDKAAEWAAQYDLPRKPLDDWLERYGDSDGQVPNALAAKPAGEDGFGADVKILYSFNEERPAIPAVGFLLPREGRWERGEGKDRT